MNFVWGAISDSYGRKPVLIIGMVVCLITTITLGFSKSYWLTLSCRLLAGVFGANSTVAKSFIGDLARDQKTRAFGYAMYGAVYGLSGILGPLLGGILANPAVSYPYWFSSFGFFGEYPYMIITGLIAILSSLSLLLTILYLDEIKTTRDAEYEQLEEEIDPEIINDNNPSNLLLRPKSSLSVNDSIDSGRSPLARELSLDLPFISPRPSEFRFLTWNTMGIYSA
jgi:MFS family permease